MELEAEKLLAEARLLNAAPDLLRAAEAIVRRWDSPKWSWGAESPTADLIHDLRKAITKARGKEDEKRKCIYPQCVSTTRTTCNSWAAGECNDSWC